MKTPLKLWSHSLIISVLLSSSLSSCWAQNNKKEQNTYTYTIETPIHFDAASDQEYPLLIFLHGAGERGVDLDMLGVHGPLKLIKEGIIATNFRSRKKQIQNR